MIPTKRILSYIEEMRQTAFLEAQTGNVDAGGYALRLIKTMEAWIKMEDGRDFDAEGNPIKKQAPAVVDG